MTCWSTAECRSPVFIRNRGGRRTSQSTVPRDHCYRHRSEGGDEVALRRPLPESRARTVYALQEGRDEYVRVVRTSLTLESRGGHSPSSALVSRKPKRPFSSVSVSTAKISPRPTSNSRITAGGKELSVVAVPSRRRTFTVFFTIVVLSTAIPRYDVSVTFRYTATSVGCPTCSKSLKSSAGNSRLNVKGPIHQEYEK